MNFALFCSQCELSNGLENYFLLFWMIEVKDRNDLLDHCQHFLDNRGSVSLMGRKEPKFHPVSSSKGQQWGGETLMVGRPEPNQGGWMPSAPRFCLVALWDEWAASVWRGGLSMNSMNFVHKRHNYDCSIYWPFWQHGWIAKGCGKLLGNSQTGTQLCGGTCTSFTLWHFIINY